MPYIRKFRGKSAKTSSPYPDAELPDSFTAESAAVAKSMGFRETCVNTQPTGLPKITAQLIDFVGADELGEMSQQARESVVNFAMLAWNLANLELEGRKEEADRVRAVDLRELVPDVARGPIEMLVERKKRMFPNDFRYITNVKVVEQDGRFALYAASIRPDTIMR